MPATSSVTKRFQFIRSAYLKAKGGVTALDRRPRPLFRWFELRDRLVLAVDDLEDVELGPGEVAVRREADGRAEDRARKGHLAEVLAELRAGDPVVLARLRDRSRIHLREHVVRCAKRAR